MTWYAHSPSDEIPELWQPLDEHLRNVAETAGSFASEFGCEQWGYSAGVQHDIGKACDIFQARLSGSGKRVDHASPGAALVIEENRDPELGNLVGDTLALTISGHHGGIPNYLLQEKDEHTPLHERLAKFSDSQLKEFAERFTEMELDAPTLQKLEEHPAVHRLLDLQRRGLVQQSDFNRFGFSSTVFCRMLFSCLVDADYLDTERFLTPDVHEDRHKGSYGTIAALEKRLDDYMAQLEAKAPDTPVNRARASILRDCRSKAKSPQGLFTLTVATGGGKTLASLAFALRHARINGARRVIFAIPYTSIVEQNAAVFRQVLGAENVLEHHSNYDFEVSGGERARHERLAVQNWDAPVIVTTNVQLLESLFSNKPGKCRKLHNIVGSVIVLDEAQTLPDDLLTPTLAMFEELCDRYRTSIVLCTATQPALDKHWPYGAKPVEIVTHRDGFEEAFGQRVSFKMLGEINEEALAARVAAQQQALCIVDTKRKARALYEQVLKIVSDADGGVEPFDRVDGVFHLSANMTPLHRSSVLEEIRRRLESGERCVVISTQLIEAGVDVDFPVVFREMAGIDSLFQAAGRCNREGRRETGEVWVFDLTDERSSSGVPLGRTWLARMKEIARLLLKDHGRPFDDKLVEDFFHQRYLRAAPDAQGIYKLLADSEVGRTMSLSTSCLERVARKYRIIDDSAIPVFVPWGEEGRSLLSRLRRAVERGMSPAVMTMVLQRSSVSVRADLYDRLRRDGAIDSETYAPINVLLEDGCRTFYSNEVGLLEPGKEELATLVV
ncbi:MAG: CRISPR-associated helicase Cas3' [Collinsella sp.]|nr:CRISPR-associated helicase Cas3' [Collinsella sp.]